MNIFYREGSGTVNFRQFLLATNMSQDNSEKNLPKKSTKNMSQEIKKIIKDICYIPDIRHLYHLSLVEKNFHVGNFRFLCVMSLECGVTSNFAIYERCGEI